MKTTFLVIFIVASSSLIAQTTMPDRVVYAAAGRWASPSTGFSFTNDKIVVYTIGEPIIYGGQVGTNFIHNGFEQPDKLIPISPTVVMLDKPNPSFKVYPNPFKNELNIKIEFTEPKKYKILYAENGIQALEFFNSKAKIDIILMDLKMPLMNGFEATQRIREIDKNIPIIAQSAYIQESIQISATKAGCNAFISKPIDKQKLYQLLEMVKV